jgi:hypothetical protein
LAKVLCWQPPSAKSLEGSGLSAEDYEPEPVEVWPENLQAFRLFDLVRNQWRTSMGGHYALDHNVVLTHMARMRLTDEEFDVLFEDIRAMEAAGLAAMREHQD